MSPFVSKKQKSYLKREKPKVYKKLKKHKTKKTGGKK